MKSPWSGVPLSKEYREENTLVLTIHGCLAHSGGHQAFEESSNKP